MSKMPWFRAYTEMIDDEKLRLLAFEDRWHFVAIMCLKGQGVLDGSDPLMMRKAAVKMGLDLRTLEEVARRLEEVGLIDKETLEPLQWDSRQMRSDADTTAADRKRRQREREKAERQSVENKGKNPSHDDVTDVSRVTVTNVTRTDIDTDKDKETEVIKPLSGSAEPNEAGRAASRFPEFWAAYPNTPRRVAKGKCLQVWKAKRLDAVADDVLSHLKAIRTTSQWLDGYEPAPLTYLRQERWEDGLPERKPVAGRHGGPSTLYEQNMAAAARAKAMIFGGSDAAV
ncbi:hypothetical protein [Paracandidimonas soli]|uniref:Uncharacterized protein n=1 Tax=Paracandidimonas soli TaxID=1917182 RepID=A0A4R3ULA5_9BURK|nr:hypothetical protein [Paracandidimonas soli]TCU91612.1 hypothetical protein EV686_1178 [Paracandidimonas soli]